MKAVITVVGTDRPGIIATVSTTIFKRSGNILDITQRVIEDSIFTMVMLVELDGESLPLIKTDLETYSEESGLVIQIHREEIFNSMHRI